MEQMVDNRWVTGRTVEDREESGLYYQTIAEALKWDKEEELVQLVKITHLGTDATFHSIGYQLVEMRISGNNEHLVLTTPNVEEALQMWMQLTFGVNIF